MYATGIPGNFHGVTICFVLAGAHEAGHRKVIHHVDLLRGRHLVVANFLKHPVNARPHFFVSKQDRQSKVTFASKLKKDTNGLYEVPNLYSISGSANFYNKTANGLTVYRNLSTGITEIYIQKVKFKHWGQTGCVQLAWDKSNGRYYKGTPSYDNWLHYDTPPSSLQPNTDFLDIVINNEKNPF